MFQTESLKNKIINDNMDSFDCYSPKFTNMTCVHTYTVASPNDSRWWLLVSMQATLMEQMKADGKYDWLKSHGINDLHFAFGPAGSFKYYVDMPEDLKLLYKLSF